jgi:membrane carboxypeptidase/penicillin-binding protein
MRRALCLGNLGRRLGGLKWSPGAAALLVCALFALAVTAGVSLIAFQTWHHVYVDREHLPDPGPLMRFEFPTIGHVYDTDGQPLVTFARERRQILQFTDIPPVVRDAILAAEDKRFFAHNGVDYRSLPRVVGKVRIANGRLIFQQGGSTITQQLVRGVFLQGQTSQEDSEELQNVGLLSRALSLGIGARNVNRVLRKREEIRLSLWIEEQMRSQFGSKRRAKEELLARYASLVYMGKGQYGFARAAEYYFGRPLSTLTADDADHAALLAGIMKAPRDYAPTAAADGPILRRRNQILALMAEERFISPAHLAAAIARPLPAAVHRAPQPFHASGVVEHVLEELTAGDADLSVDDLLYGRIQVYSTADARIQRIASDALEHGLARYEARHPGAQGVVQGSIVVLKNGDGSILAETGGRQVYQERATSYSDFNRARQSLRQPGSAMKPIVYLAALRYGNFTLETLVPDEPISVPDARAGVPKWIANYDGRFQGLIPIRTAIAESRNTVAVWITGQIGIDAVLRTSRSLGVQTPLRRFPTTALGASEVSLLELATAYRTMASGVLATPHVIRHVVRGSGGAAVRNEPRSLPVSVADRPLLLIQEALRGVVRMPTGTAHALASRAFPIAVMGKTGTTNEFRDALFVGSTYGLGGITVAVRIGFDDNRSLGSNETGGRVALPVFREVMVKVYEDGLFGPAPAFPSPMEQRITRYVETEQVLEKAATRLDPLQAMPTPVSVTLGPRTDD